MFHKNFQMLKLFYLKSLIIFMYTLTVSNAQYYHEFSLKSDLPWQIVLAKKKNKTILDYFYLLPSDFLDCDRTQQGLPSVEKRKKICRLIDEKNGYIQFYNSSQIALFKDRKKAIDIIAIQTGLCGAGSNCGSINCLIQFNVNTNTWIERTDLLPAGYSHEALFEKYINQDKCPYFDLPKEGYLINIRDEISGETICGLQWNGHSFDIAQDCR